MPGCITISPCFNINWVLAASWALGLRPLELGLCSAVPQRGRRALRHRRPGFEGRIEVHGPQATQARELSARVSHFRQLSVLIFFLALPEAAAARCQST